MNSTMRYVLVIIAVLGMGGVATAGSEPTVESLRARLKELGQLEVLHDEGKDPQEPRGPRGRTPREEALYQIVRMPRNPLRVGLGEALQSGDKEEVIGTIVVYMWTVNTSGHNFESEPVHQEYYPILLARLKRDDLQTPLYTGYICGALTLYPSRETYVAIMTAAKRSKSPKLHYELIDLTAAHLDIELGIHLQMPQMEKERTWNDFETWFWKNEKSISFDSQGRSSVAGERAKAKPRDLTDGERASIRKDPVCVLELFQGVTSGVSSSEERLATLVNQCGDSLFGPEGTKLMKQMVQESKKSGTPTFDQQMGLAAARGKYPMFNAALLAAAYVAADDPDLKHRELAKKTLDDIGTPEDITRVLKGEPKEVRQKAMALADEMNEAGG